jgi:hypothetical protein
VSVYEKTAGAGWSGTVTISYNGVVVATKSGTIKGYPSKIVLAPSKVATKASTTTALKWTAYDASGNALTGSTALTAGALAKNSFGTATVVSAITNVVLPDSSGNAGTVDITCGDAGSSTVVLQYTRPDGGVILSNNVTQQCGGSPDSYKAAFDKTSYNQGDLATLTISVVDSKGNPASSFVNVIDSSTITAGDSAISTPMMTLVGAYPAVQKLDSAGKVTFTYTVGTTGTFTPGNYQASVSLPTVNAVNGKAQTVAYTIGSTGGTSLNDVLKGIVSLIASINKQIAALAKLVSKK